MYYNLCIAYSGPDDPIKEKETSEPYKTVMREHEGAQFIIYHNNING